MKLCRYTGIKCGVRGWVSPHRSPPVSILQEAREEPPPRLFQRYTNTITTLIYLFQWNIIHIHTSIVVAVNPCWPVGAEGTTGYNNSRGPTVSLSRWHNAAKKLQCRVANINEHCALARVDQGAWYITLYVPLSGVVLSHFFRTAARGRTLWHVYRRI